MNINTPICEKTTLVLNKNKIFCPNIENLFVITRNKNKHVTVYYHNGNKQETETIIYNKDNVYYLELIKSEIVSFFQKKIIHPWLKNIKVSDYR